MADNAKIPENSSSTVLAACDEVSFSGDTAKLQIVRPIASVSGSEGSKTITDLAYGAGASSAGTRRVILATDDALVALTANWNESNRLKANIIVGQAGVQGGSGLVSDNTQRVVLATDVALPTGNNNIGQVNVAAIAAGDNNIGNVDIASALPAGDNNIGNVDIVTMPSIPAGTNNIGDVDIVTIALAQGSGAVSGTTLRTITASDDPTVTLLTSAVNVLTLDIGAILTGWEVGGLPAGNNNIGNVDIVTIPLTQNTGVIDSTTLRTTLASDDPAVTALQVIDDWDANDRCKTSLIVGQDGVDGNTGTVSAKTVRTTLATDVGLPTGTNTLGQVGIVPVTSGGLTASKTISAATTNATSVKASAGQLYHLLVSNINAAVRYLKFYNKASAPTVGTDTPIWTIPIPGNTAGAGVNIAIPPGLTFSSGIAFALTTGVADSDTGAVSANEHVVNLGYK